MRNPLYFVMRNVSFVMPLRAERVSDVSRPKNIREEEQTKRVRDVKESEKQEKKSIEFFGFVEHL
ncbi:hypothetical protein ACZ98_10525 [Vibrio parahaemolyticus]|nr:hypothetical protein ACZ98_10525 [Vibrio parahaemolyticus]